MPTTDHLQPPAGARLWAALVFSGLVWGATGPVSKLSVSTGNHPLAINFFTAALASLLLAAVLAATGRRLPLDRRSVAFFLFCGLLGTALPGTVSLFGYRHLPVGVMMIVLAFVPMATLLLALPLGLERPQPHRLAGLALGAGAVLLIALPDASLPVAGQAIHVALPVIVALSYAGENVYIASARPPGCDAVTVLCGLSWAATLLLAPTLLLPGVWFDPLRFGPAELAVVANTGLHLIAYFTYIWLIGHAGPVFAAQIAYVVTGFGVVIGMVVEGERHSPWIWAALALMFAGLALVKPAR